MKIGAGGLQSLASQGVVPVRSLTEPGNAVNREGLFPGGAVLEEQRRKEIERAVKKLNKSAQAYEQRLELRVRRREEEEDEEQRKSKIKIEVKDRKTGQIKGEMSIEEVIEASKKGEKAGIILDRYL